MLVVVNLDPYHAQAGLTWLDMWQLGMENARTVRGPRPAHRHDATSGTVRSNYVRLDPSTEPAHVLRLRPL